MPMALIISRDKIAARGEVPASSEAVSKTLGRCLIGARGFNITGVAP